MAKYWEMTRAELLELKTALVMRGSMNAAREVGEFIEYYGERVRVVKGRKVPHGTEGVVVWLRRYDNSKYGDPWGIYSNTRIGIKDDSGTVHYTALDNVEKAGGANNDKRTD